MTADVEHLKRRAALLRRVIPATVDFAANYRRWADDRERQARDLSLELTEIERQLAETEKA